MQRFPRGSIYTTIMALGPQNHNGDGLLGPNSIIVVYMGPSGFLVFTGQVLLVLHPKQPKPDSQSTYTFWGFRV